MCVDNIVCIFYMRDIGEGVWCQIVYFLKIGNLNKQIVLFLIGLIKFIVNLKFVRDSVVRFLKKIVFVGKKFRIELG